MARSEFRTSLTCTREVLVLIRGDLFSERHNVVSSDNTGSGYRLPNVPAQMTADSASPVRYETKMSGQEISYAASWEVIFIV